MANGTLVKPKVMAIGAGASFAAALLAVIQGFWPEMNIPPGLEGLIAGAAGFALAWFKKE